MNTDALVVDASGRGTHRSVIEAVAVATPGARITVHPGTYAGPVVLKDDIGLVAEGPRDRVVIVGTGTCAVEVASGRSLVQGLTLRVVVDSDDDLDFLDSVPALRIAGGRPEIVDCDVSSAMGAGIAVRGADADPSVTGTVVHGCEEYGIWVYEQGKGTFERCGIVGNAYAGIAVKDGGDPVVRDCQVRDGKQVGIYVHTQGKGTFERCEVVGNASAGIAVWGDPVVRDCQVRDGRQEGIWVNPQGKGTFERCEVVGNALAGIVVRAGGDPVVRDCLVRSNRDGGVIVDAGASGTITGCTVGDNTPDNWRVEARMARVMLATTNFKNR